MKHNPRQLQRNVTCDLFIQSELLFLAGNKFGGIYTEPKDLFPNFAIDPETVGEVWPDYGWDPAVLGTFKHTRNGALVGTRTMKKFDWKVGDEIASGDKVEPKVGNAMPLRSIPTGQLIHNLELTPGRGGQMVRSAGTFAQLLAKEGNYADVLLPSGEIRKVHVRCRATVGQIGNSEWAHIILGKAGRKRWLGVRPTVRGKAMNPVSHPCGGGDGRGGVGRQPCNWKGTKLAKGGKTRRSKKPSDRFIVRFRRAGPHQNTRR